MTTLARQNSTATKNLNQPNAQNTDTIIPYIDVNSQNKIVNPRYKTYEQMNLESTSPTPAPGFLNPSATASSIRFSRAAPTALASASRLRNGSSCRTTATSCSSRRAPQARRCASSSPWRNKVRSPICRPRPTSLDARSLLNSHQHACG